MNHFWATFFICLLLITVTGRLQAVFNLFTTTDMDIERELRDQLNEEFTKPNKWNYKLVYPFTFDVQNGLVQGTWGMVRICDKWFESPEDAESYFVEIYSDLLKRFNSIRAIRPFLAQFPSTPAVVGLKVQFCDDNGKFHLSPYMKLVALMGYKPERETLYVERGGGKQVEEKDPKEILGVRELYDIRVPRSVSAKKPKIMVYTGLSGRKSDPADKAEMEFMKTFCSAHNLYPLVQGTVGAKMSDPIAIEFPFRGAQTVSLEQARVLAATCGKEMLEYGQKDKRIIELMKKRSQIPQWKDPSIELLPRHISFRISFWDENVDRVAQPHIAEIRVLAGKFTYYTADEGQRLVPVYSESFDEAVGVL